MYILIFIHFTIYTFILYIILLYIPISLIYLFISYYIYIYYPIHTHLTPIHNTIPATNFSFYIYPPTYNIPNILKIGEI